MIFVVALMCSYTLKLIKCGNFSFILFHFVLHYKCACDGVQVSIASSCPQLNVQVIDNNSFLFSLVNASNELGAFTNESKYFVQIFGNVCFRLSSEEYLEQFTRAE